MWTCNASFEILVSVTCVSVVIVPEMFTILELLPLFHV